MKIGLIGLGRMGSAIVYRLIDAGHEVVAFDLDGKAREAAQKMGATIATDLADIAAQTRVIWVMVPVGGPVDAVIKELQQHLKAGDVIVEGGNSNYADSITRAKALAMNDIFFLDCGTSGGVHGRAVGFCLMVGGDKMAYTKVHPIFAAVATPGGLAHVGPSGSGHYTKMIHNGIEYGLMQAYAEGFQLLKEGSFKEVSLDLEEITRIWNKSSIIRSWILELSHDIFQKDQELHGVSGEVAETGMGKWTAQEARKNNIPTPVLDEALKTRTWSRETGGNYATKVLAMLRNKFGGHAVKKIEE